MNKTSRILVPVDFSEPSAAALERALELAEPGNLALLHVLSWPTADLGYFTPVTDKEQALQKLGAAFREAALHRAWPADKPPRLLVREGFPPAEEIIDTARREKADLIVMGTHGRRGVSHLFLGSVAERVIRGAPCPVMTCRRGAPAPAPESERTAPWP